MLHGRYVAADSTAVSRADAGVLTPISPRPCAPTHLQQPYAVTCGTDFTKVRRLRNDVPSGVMKLKMNI